MRSVVRQVDLCKLTPQDVSDINSILRQSANATVFHTIEWNKILIDVFGLHNVTLVATVDGEPEGLYSFYVDGRQCHSSVTRLESVYGGPISIGESASIVALLRKAEALQKIAQFRIWTGINCDTSPLVGMGYSCREMYTSILDLQRPEDVIWEKVHKKTRNMIRKAMKSKVLVTDGDASLVDEYYDMVVSTFTRAQLDLKPKSFYRRVVEDLGAAGLAKFLLARHNGRFISGAIFLLYKDTVYYWHGASHREYLSVAPNELLQWQLIKWARQNGYKFYDLVRVEPDRLPGIARFKMRFGGDTVPCYLMAKATPGYRVWRALGFIVSPKRILRRIRSS